MKRLLIALLAAYGLIGGVATADELEDELRRIAELQRQLDPLTEPIRIDGSSLRLFTHGLSVPFLVDTFMSQPPANRTLRFDMVDQKKPLMDSNGGALGCGWFVELNGRFWVTALGESLDTRWVGDGKLVTDPILRIDTSIQPRGYVKPPPCPAYIKCKWTKKCRWGICVPWYECTGRVLSCDKCSVGGGFEVLPPRLNFGGTIDYSGVEISVRPLSEFEQAIISMVGDHPGISTTDLAEKIAEPRPQVKAAAEFLEMAALLEESGGWKLRNAMRGARHRPGGVVVVDVVQPNVYYIINFKRCLDLPFNADKDDPCLEVKEEYPSGRLATLSVFAEHESYLPIEVEDTRDLVFDGPWKGRDARSSVLASTFETTSDGLGLDALVHLRWSDIAALEKFLKVHMLDVGDGEAIFIEAPAADPVTPGPRMLVGAGSRQSAGRLGRYLERTVALRPGDRIDYFVVTHPGADMLADALEIVRRFEIGTLVHPGAPGGLAQRRLLTEAQERGVRIVDLRREAVDFELGRDVQVETLFSYDPSLPTPWGRRQRDASIVLKLSHGERSFLLTGDAGSTVEERLLASGADLRADVLKVADRGSDDASSAPFVDAVAPQWALISAYGGRGWPRRPSPTTLARLEERGVPWVSTTNGDRRDRTPTATRQDDVVVLSDGESLTVLQYDPVDERWRFQSR